MTETERCGTAGHPVILPPTGDGSSPHGELSTDQQDSIRSPRQPTALNLG